jgi:DNA polymerase III epsilon subunit-like protein
MTGRGIPQRNKLSPRLDVPIRNYDGKAMYFRERQKFSLTQPYLDADIAVKVLAEGMVATGSGGDREMTGDDDQPTMAEFRFDPLARRQPGQVLKLHTTYKEATTPGDGHNWGWVDPEPELSDEERRQFSEEAADFISKRPQVIVRQFMVDKDGNETGETNEIAVKQLGPTINDMMPGQAIKLRKAISKGIIIDANGHMRCPPGTPNANQFTDVDMSNCFNIGVGAVQKEIRRIRGWWKELEEDVAALSATRTAKERFGKAKLNYTSLDENAEWLARNEQSVQDAFSTLGIDLSQFTPEQLKQNVHLFTALDELFKNHDGPEFRRFLHDAIGFKWNDSKTVDENMKDYWATLNETVYKLVPEEVKKALLIDPSTKKPVYPDRYDEAQKIVDMMIDRFREVQEGIIQGALVSFNDNPQMFQTLREIGFDAHKGRVSLNEWMSYEGITNPITDDLSPGRLGTQINFNTWALVFKPLLDMRKLDEEGRFEIDLKPVDAQGTPLGDIEKLKQIRDIIAQSNEVDHFIHGVGYANEQSSARASAVAGMSPAKARAMHVMFHEFGHVLQYAEAQNAIIDYVNKHGQLVVANNGRLNVLTGDWRTWSNNDWYDALNTVMRGTFEGMNYPPVTVDWLEDSMLHLLAGQYYQDELGNWQRMHLDGGQISPMLRNAQVGLMIQEARAELYALRQMGVISGPDIDKAVGGMDEVRRPPGIELASRPIYDAPTENVSNLVPRSIFSGKRDLRRKAEYPKEVTKYVKKMKKDGYSAEEILNDLNAGDPENPKFTLDDVNKMIDKTGADDVPTDWMSSERENGIPKFDPANGIYADWSPDVNDDGPTRQAKINTAIDDYANSNEFLQDMEDAGFDQTDPNHMGDFVRTNKYKESFKKYQEKYGKPESLNEAGAPTSDGEPSTPNQKRDIPAWDGQTDSFATDYSEVKLTDALIDDYTNTDYTVDELAERYDRTPEEVKAKIDLQEKLDGPIERVNVPQEPENATPVTPASNPKEWGRQRRQEILDTTEPETVALLDGSTPPDLRSSTRALAEKETGNVLAASANARSKAKENADTIGAPTPDTQSPLLDEEIRDAVAPLLFHIDSHEFDEDMSVMVAYPLPRDYEVGGGEIVTKPTPTRGILIGEGTLEGAQPNMPENTRVVRLSVPAGSRGTVVGNSFNGDSDGILLPPGDFVITGVDENGVIEATIHKQETPLETLKRMDANIDSVSSADGIDDSVKNEASIVKAEIGRQIEKYVSSERGQGMRSRSRGTSGDVLTQRNQEQRNSFIAIDMRRKNSSPFNVDNNYSARHKNPDGMALSTQWGSVVPREVHVNQRNNRVSASLGRMRNIINGDVSPSNESEFDFINNLDPRIKTLLNDKSPEEVLQMIDDAYSDFHKGFDDRVRIPMNENTLNGLMSNGRLKTIQEIKPNNPISKLKSDHELFLGYDPEVPDSTRSISGYMVHRNAKNVISDHLDSIPSDGVNRNPDFFHESGDVQPMGDVRLGGNDIDLVLKPEVASRSAYSRGEAIRSHNYPTPVLFDNPGDVGSAHLNESITTGNSELDRTRNIANALQNVIDNNFSGALSDDLVANRSDRALRPGNKYEALVAGGVSLDDVAEMRYPVNKLDVNNEKLDMNSLIGDSGRELLKTNGFGDGEINEYLRMVDDGEVDLQAARWLKQHRAAKKFDKDFRKKNNFDGRMVFTNPDGIDLMSPETFREHPSSRGLQTVEQMLSARMLDDMAPNLKKTLKAIKKSPDAQARIRSAQIGQNKKPNVGVPNAGSRINSIEDNEVDDIFNSLTDDLRNIAKGVDVDRGMRSRSVPENLPPETFSYGNPENADVPGKKAFRDNSIYVTRNDDGTFNAYTIENYPGTELGYLRQVGDNNHESLAAAKNAAGRQKKLSSRESGMRSRSVPETFNDYADNPPRQGMRSQSGPKPPQYPRKPTMGAFIGSADSEFDGITNWQDFKRAIADKEIVFIDYETTGLKFNEFNESAGNGLPTQIGAVKIKNGKVIDRFNVFINPGTPMSEWEKWSRDNLKDGDGNPITDAYLADKPSIADAHKQLVEFMGNTELMGMQNAVFDNEVLEDALKDSGIDWRPRGIIDTKEISDMVLPKWSETNQDAPFKVNKDGTKSPSNSLGDITKYLGVDLGDKHHNADADAEATAKVMQAIIDGAIENDWPTDILDKTKRRTKENETKTKFEKAVAAFESEKETFLNTGSSMDSEGGMRSRTATKPAKSTTKRTPKPKVVEPREYRNSNTENLPRSRDYYNVEDIDNAMRDIIDDVYSGIREPQDITDRVNSLRDDIRDLGSSSGMPDDMIEDLLDGTKTGPIASEVNDIVGGFERWGGLRSRTNVGSNTRTKAGVAGRIISSERSRKALEKLGIDEDRAEAVQLLGEMAAAFSISGPAGMGSVLARRAGRDVADFGLAEAVERGWMSQATADKVAKRMLDRVAPEGLPEDIKDIIEKGKDAVTSDESKARAAELLDTIRETVRSGGMQRLVDSAKQKTRVLTDIAKERGRELAADKLREARDRAREMAQERASELADEAMGALRERGKEAAGRLVGRFARRGGK